MVRLLGNVRGKRVLELGCGTGDTAVEFVTQGATVIGVDGSAENIAAARVAAEAAEVRVELHAARLPVLVGAEPMDEEPRALLLGPEGEGLDAVWAALAAI